ncbi:hypothetical protein GmHk_14G041287 [Glycine max]|nr:hypothetical protein GmHk_14G041287 [Glycine max]
MIHLRKILMKMSSLSFHERSAKYGKTKVDPSGKATQEEFPKKRKIKTKKGRDEKKYFKIKEKRGLMSSWEDLNDTSYDEDGEEANICLMADTNSEESKSDKEDEIRTLKTTLAKIFNETDNLNKLLEYCRHSLDKSRNGYDRKVYVHDKDTIVCYFYGKTGHMTSKCKDRPKKGTINTFMANTKRPKKIWVP